MVAYQVTHGLLNASQPHVPPEHFIEQHCALVVQLCPWALQADAHTPLSHWRNPQQSLVSAQVSPTARQPVAPHWPLVHCCEQHCPADWQGWPAGTHAPAPQTPLVQLIEQHCAAFAQSWPFGVHPLPAMHLASAQAPEQQSTSPVQASSFAAQLPAPHTPPVHASEQHSVAAAHESPSLVHDGAPLLVDELAPPVPVADELV
jgi:hypothetical protein